MLDKNALKEKLKTAVQSGPFPESGSVLSAAIVSYVKANGTPKAPTISYTLAPASGSGWALLIPKAGSLGVADYIISMAIATEFAGSMKVIPAAPSPITVPMSFNTGAKVADMSGVKDFDESWDKIAAAIIEFFKPEIE